MDPQLALLRPDTFVVVALLLAILGGVSIATIPVDIFPYIDIPVVSVVWQYHGLTREEMEPHRYKLPASAHVHREADSRRSSSRVPSRDPPRDEIRFYERTTTLKSRLNPARQAAQGRTVDLLPSATLSA